MRSILPTKGAEVKLKSGEFVIYLGVVKRGFQKILVQDELGQLKIIFKSSLMKGIRT